MVPSFETITRARWWFCAACRLAAVTLAAYVILQLLRSSMMWASLRADGNITSFTEWNRGLIWQLPWMFATSGVLWFIPERLSRVIFSARPPRCPSCEYELGHTVPDRCTECGLVFKPSLSSERVQPKN